MSAGLRLSEKAHCRRADGLRPAACRVKGRGRAVSSLTRGIGARAWCTGTADTRTRPIMRLATPVTVTRVCHCAVGAADPVFWFLRPVRAKSPRLRMAIADDSRFSGLPCRVQPLPARAAFDSPQFSDHQTQIPRYLKGAFTALPVVLHTGLGTI